MLVKIKSFLGKQLIEKVNSPISGEVRIFEVLGRPSMVVGGLEQSGAFIGGIWKKALKKLQNSKTPKLQISDVLILGLGGGTVAKLVNKFWPDAKIVGLEIDPVVIELGKKYFALDKIPNLEIITADACEWTGREKSFDLVLVDLYVGDQVPEKAKTQEFLKRVKQLLTPGGFAIFNRLFYKEKKKETEVFIKKLEKIFPRFSFVRTPSNLLIFVQK